MATCTINSAYLTMPNRNAVYMQQASIAYYASATLPSTNYSTESEGQAVYTETSTGGGETDLTLTITRYYSQSKTREKYEYSNLVYSWEFNSNPLITANGASGIKNYVTNLNIGAENAISATVTVTCTKTSVVQYATRNWTEVYSYSRPSTDVEFSLVDTTTSSGTYSTWFDQSNSSLSTPGQCEATQTTDPLLVYTRPGLFTNYNFAANTIITQSPGGLTAAKVGLWIQHCNRFAHWYNQNNNDVIIKNNQHPNNNLRADCYVSPNDVITAAWYNTCIDAIPGLTNTQKNNYVDNSPAGYLVHGGNDGTLITAAIINLLGALISKDDS